MLEIRRLSEEDVSRIHELEVCAFPDPWSENSIRESLLQNHTILLGAWLEGILCGYVIFYFSFEEGEIARIAVEPSARRRGVAGRLLSELESICGQKDIYKIMLDVRESNKTAVRFYKSRGFEEDGIRKNFYTGTVNGYTNQSEDAILMSRELGK